MDTKELRQKNKDQLKEAILEFRKELREISLNTLQGKEKNVKKAGSVRKSIARALTVLAEKKFLDTEK